MGDIIHLDYETFSPQPLKDVGAFRYASDPDCQILMAAVALNDEEPSIWIHPDHCSKYVCSEPRALEIMKMWEDPEVLVYAHNAQFEMAVSKYRIEKDIGIKAPLVSQWRCTQTMARRAAIPASLKPCAEYLGLPQQKDSKGLALIKRFSVPRKPTKRDPRTRITGKDDPDQFSEFVEYCLQDVRTEQAVHEALLPFEFKGAQLRGFIFDGELNMRGIPVNREALLNADVIIKEVMADLGKRFTELTGYTAKQNKKITEWFKERGYPFKGMGADLVEKALEDMSWAKSAKTREALTIRAALGFAAVGKVSKMLECDCGDGWVRGCFMYYGAGTGRWSAKLIQPQNFKKPSEHLKKHTEDAYLDIIDGASREEIEILYGNPLDVISSSIRHFIQWKEGDLLQADYSSIEARIVCWLAGQTDALQRVRDYDMKKPGAVEPYVYMASRIWTQYSPKDIEAMGKECFERFVGKQAVLGCGFQMSAPKFQATCLKYGQHLDLDVCELTVNAFRKTYDKVAKLWKEVERAARNAILHPGRMFQAGPKLRFVTTTVAGKLFLLMKLPSGRSIVYPEPKIEPGGKFGDQITFYGQIQGKSLWGRISTYGAKLVENATQATAFDIMVHGAVQASQEGFEIVALIHDEALALKQSWAKLERFTAVLADLPAWAAGLPIVAEGKVFKWYKK